MTDALADPDASTSEDEPTLLDGPEPELLLSPRDGMPPLVVHDVALAELAERLAAGTGPVAVDAERASGYRYGQRAYLVQLRRAGAGSAMVDPTGCPDLSILGEALADAEWVLHAASQDLPCLAEVGMVPTRIFDTELAGRLAGFERVGLGAMVERVLGLRLEKGHSAADWSRRPLPEPWLQYAALDVEVLIELRDALETELDAQGKLGWAHEEFSALVEAPPKEPRTDPWRRTSGIHRIRNRRQLAAVRALWEVRDDLARTRDIARAGCSPTPRSSPPSPQPPPTRPRWSPCLALPAEASGGTPRRSSPPTARPASWPTPIYPRQRWPTRDRRRPPAGGPRPRGSPTTRPRTRSPGHARRGAPAAGREPPAARPRAPGDVGAAPAAGRRRGRGCPDRRGRPTLAGRPHLGGHRGCPGGPTGPRRALTLGPYGNRPSLLLLVSNNGDTTSPPRLE